MMASTETPEIKIGGLHQKLTPPVGSMVHEKETDARLSVSSESDEFDNEICADTLAHKLSIFLSSGSDSGEVEEQQVSETIITDVYKDPLDKCMEAIEDMAHGILRTGKLSISGDPGDMSKVQPSLFNLQASEKEMGQLIPQLLQTAFFYQAKEDNMFMEECSSSDDETFIAGSRLDLALSKGFIRLALPVDTAIFVLLRSHCCKTASQAEELINAIIIRNYIPTHMLLSFPSMPPIIKFHPTSNKNSVHGLIQNGGLQRSLNVRNQGLNKTSSSSLSAEERSTTGSKLSTYSSLSMGTNRTSGSSLYHSEESELNLNSRRDSDESSVHSHCTKTTSSSGSTLRGVSINEEEEVEESKPVQPIHIHNQLVRTISDRVSDRISSERVRKSSMALQPPVMRIRSSSLNSETDIHYVPSSDSWNTNIMDNNTIIAQYGANTYPLLWWESSFKIDFRLSSSVGLLAGMVTGIDPLRPEVTLRVFNNSAKQIGFSIRSYRQSTIFKSHVVYPPQGLEILGPYKSWEDNVEFHPTNSSTTEMFVIDLFFCTMDTKPVWNINRKYVIMKAQKSPKDLRRLSRRRSTHLALPGTKDLKEDNLKLVLSHGLQCIVKGNLDKAEIIFSHALYLPDFQRVPLKAFVYICLAVTAKKRKDLGHSTSFTPMLVAGEASDKLISKCELGSGSIKMPHTLTLVKQLKKELNIEKITKEERKKHESAKRGSLKVEDSLIEDLQEITPEGGAVNFKDTRVVIPPDALTQTTKVSVSLSDTKHLVAMLKSSGWDKIVQVATAVDVECTPPTDCFKKPIHITTLLPKGVKVGESSLVRLMHSRFLRHWEDITDDPLSKIYLTEDKVYIDTNLPGWLAVSVIQFNPSKIAQMVLKSISVEPIMLRVSIYCKSFGEGDRNSIQVAVFVVPCKSNEESIFKEHDKPEDFIPVSFPQVIRAYPNETLHLDIKGSFEPDKNLGEKDLTFEIDVHNRHNQVETKWIKMLSSSHQHFIGTLKVTSCRNSTNSWENIASISLAMRRTGYSNSSTSSSSEQ